MGKKIKNYSWQARQDALSVVIDKNNIWRVAYLLSQDEERKRQNKGEQLLNLDGLINLSDGSGYWGIIAKSIQREQTSMALMFIAAGADLEIILHGEPAKRAMLLAIQKDNTKMVEILYAAGAEIYPSYIEHVNSTKMRNLFKEKLVSQSSNENIKTTTKINEQTEWKKIDNSTISKTVQNDEIKIKTLFNFKAGRITILHDVIDSNGKVTHSYVPVTEKIRSIQQDAEVKEAYDKLTSMNGGVQPVSRRLRVNKTARRILHHK